MKYSIIMPSYLGYYSGAANDRDKKIHRAIASVLKQTLQDFELIVVADGCDQTFEIMRKYNDKRISCSLIDKQPLWSGRPRNMGIYKAQGEFIIYLDIDDIYGEDHLKIIDNNIGSYDWVYFNDLVYRGNQFKERGCEIFQMGHSGTSNIVHKRSLNLQWLNTGYAHDWHFVKSLIASSKNFSKITTPQYYVCHIPHQYDK